MDNNHSFQEKFRNSVLGLNVPDWAEKQGHSNAESFGARLAGFFLKSESALTRKPSPRLNR